MVAVDSDSYGEYRTITNVYLLSKVTLCASYRLPIAWVSWSPMPNQELI